MNLMKWLNKKTKTVYKELIIPAKALELIELLDTELTTKCKGQLTNESRLSVKSCQISIYNQLRPLSYIQAGLLNQLPDLTNKFYIPRSIAFFIDADGTWYFTIGIRDIEGSDETTMALFIDALTRTNSARQYNISTNGE